MGGNALGGMLFIAAGIGVGYLLLRKANGGAPLLSGQNSPALSGVPPAIAPIVSSPTQTGGFTSGDSVPGGSIFELPGAGQYYSLPGNMPFHAAGPA